MTRAQAHSESQKRRIHYLHPGQLHASIEPCAISTVLGSCVAVCLWDPLEHVGGMNHFVLPFATFAQGAGSAKFCNTAMTMLLQELQERGAVTSRLQAKMFGGACVIRAFQGQRQHIGSRNIDAAREQLAQHRIPIIGEDVGGLEGRRLIFHTDEGIALVRKL